MHLVSMKPEDIVPNPTGNVNDWFAKPLNGT